MKKKCHAIRLRIDTELETFNTLIRSQSFQTTGPFIAATLSPPQYQTIRRLYTRPTPQFSTALSLLATSSFSSILSTLLSRSNWKSLMSIVGTNSGAFVNK